MVWPFGTQKNVCRKVRSKKRHQSKNIYHLWYFQITVFYRSRIWKYGQLHRPGRVCGHVSQRRETSGGTLKPAYFTCEAKKLTTYYEISEGRSKPCEKRFCNILKKVCLVLFFVVFFRAAILQQAQKKRYTPRTQVTCLWSVRPKPHWPAFCLSTSMILDCKTTTCLFYLHLHGLCVVWISS